MREKVNRKKRKRVRQVRMALVLIILAVVVIGAVFVFGDGLGNRQTSGSGQGEGQNGKNPSDPFQALYFYEEDKAERYEAYQDENSDFTADEVVWRVNAGLDRPFFEGVIEIEDTSVKPLVVNKYYKLPEDFVPENLVDLPSGRQVNAETKEAYDRMKQDAAKLDLRISEGSAYRSISYQEEVYGRYLETDSVEVVDSYSARPGHSDHHTGEVLDLLDQNGSLTGFGGTAESDWVAKYAYKYGFIIRYPEGKEDITGYMYEPWHIKYVGEEIAKTMREQGIETLEEYKVKYMDHRPPEL